MKKGYEWASEYKMKLLFFVAQIIRRYRNTFERTVIFLLLVSDLKIKTILNVKDTAEIEQKKAQNFRNVEN